MNETSLIITTLKLVFLIGGAFLVLLGFFIWRKLWDNYSVPVEAECIDLNEHTEKVGTGIDKTYFYDAKHPIYKYIYEGNEYISGPKLSSNRPGYKPKVGNCIIRINPENPKIVYSSERKFVAIILILIGSIWILCAGIIVIFC